MPRTRCLLLTLSIVQIVVLGSPTWASEVSGRIEMPPACAPEISPAVVWLEPKDGPPEPAPSSAGESRTALVVNQKMLQFRPRVQALEVGRTITFSNADAERHNIHVQGPGVNFNQTIAPGETAKFTPVKPGVLHLFCDIHLHMRGFAIVSAGPWIATCDRTGGYRLKDVPEGKYTLNVWHELGEPLSKPVEVVEGKNDLGTIALKGPEIVNRSVARAKVEPWPEVVDRVSVLLASSLDAATRKKEGAAGLAVSRVDDAYFAVFEGSDMETAIRSALGIERAISVEEAFQGLRKSARKVAEGKEPATGFANQTRGLLQTLLKDALDLNAMGITDRSKMQASLMQAASSSSKAANVSKSEMSGQLEKLREAFDGVKRLAGEGEAREAAGALVSTYFEVFEPIERTLNVRNPSAVRPLETRFAALRTEVDSGLKGEDLERELGALHQSASVAMEKAEEGASSVFGLAFAASLGTILREGVEVILLLSMLVALVAKAGRPRGAMAALWWGVGLAVVASAGTAVGLNMVVSGARGRSRELMEAVVMLAASGVLFYVSYWLISQSESKRWMDFLKRQANHGAAVRGYFTLGLTAFLAVFREGAETALMYQAMLSNQPPQGLLGIVAGLAVGAVLLAVFALVLRITSVRLPMRLFFQVTGVLLFAMSVIFAGNAVLELQVAGVLKTTALEWMGGGAPMIGVHPTAQGVAIQGLLLLGAVLAVVTIGLGRRCAPARKEARVETPTQGAGRPSEEAVSARA